MNRIADALHDVDQALGDAALAAFAPRALHPVDDAALVALLAQAAGIARRAEAIMIATVAELHDRIDAAPPADRLTTRLGCRSLRELVQRSTRVAGRTAGDLVSAGRAVHRTTALTTGDLLAASYPALRSAVADGAIGLDGLTATTRTLDSTTCTDEARRAADLELAASARGEGADAFPPPSADELRLQAQVWAMYLDQDGAEPREVRALRKRGVSLGVCRDGLVPVSGHLLPEVAGQLQRLFDSILNPRVEGPDGHGAPTGPRFTADPAITDDAAADVRADLRTHPQRRHDALATVLTVAARSGALPTIGGAAPTLVVAVQADDLAAGRGSAHLDGCTEPVSIAVARQVACAGAVQRVTLDGAGRILAIAISDRVFAAHQRRAIAMRDGGCIIPGCQVTAPWCEIHHVTEHAAGGATHTDNGVLLCWHHHRTIDSGGWKIRMRGGLPEVRGPSWWDASLRWRPATTSPMRLSRALRVTYGG